MTVDPQRCSRISRPSGGVLVCAYFVAVAAPLVLAAASSVPPDNPWGEAATAAGAMALAAMVVQFLTSGRFEIFAGRLGIDATMAFHKWVARLILLAVVLHPVLYAAPTLLTDWDRGFARLAGMASAPRLSTGVAAWAAAVLLVLLGVARKWLPVPYELWRGTHFVLAMIAVGGGLAHALGAGTYSAEPMLWRYWLLLAGVAAAAVLLLYGWRWWSLHGRAWRLESVRQVGTALWELSLVPQPRTPALAFRAGQFVWISVAPRRFPLFDHPFSIASAPGEPTLRLIVKELGDFTSRIGQLAPGTRIGLDGPHGHFTMDDKDADAVLLIAGGVGIAPVMGLLRDLVRRRDGRPVRFVYGAGSPDKIACRDEIMAATEVIGLKALLVSEKPTPEWPGEVGIVDRAILERALEGLDPGRVLALVCGPNAMVTAVADNLDGLGLAPDRIVYERFDYDPRSAPRRERRRRRQLLWLAAGLVLAVLAFAWR